MLHLFREVAILHQEGKIHRALIIRVGILFVISIIIAGIVWFNVWVRDVSVINTLSLQAVGFILGLYVFSRMNIVNWNEKDEIVQAGKMDTLGYITIVLYIVFEIGLRTLFNDFYPLGATVLIVAVISGTLIGRTFGIIMDIHRVFKLNHFSK